jgi:hypothetical protein
MVSAKLVKMGADAMDAFLSLGKMEDAGEATKAAAEQYDNLKNTLVDIGLQFVEMVNSAMGTSDILKSITEGIKEVWEKIKEPVYSFVTAMKAAFVALYEIYSEIIKSIASVFGINITSITDSYLAFIKKLYDRIRFFFENWRDFFKLMKAIAILQIQNMWERIKTWAINAVEIFRWAIDNWRDILTSFAKFTKTVFENLWTNMKTGWKAFVAVLNGEKVDFKWIKLHAGFKAEFKSLPKLTQANIQETTEEIQRLSAKLGQKWREFQSRPSDMPTPNTKNKSHSTGWEAKGEMKIATAGSAFVGIADLAKQSQEASLKRIQERQLAELQKNVNVMLQLYDLAKHTGIKLASGAPAVYQ